MQGHRSTVNGVCVCGPICVTTHHGVPDIRREIAEYEERHGKYDRFEITVYTGHPKESDVPWTYADIMSFYDLVTKLSADIEALRASQPPQ
jgi:hypothetical protein